MSVEAQLIANLKSRLKGNSLRLALYVMQNPVAKIEDLVAETGLSRDGVNYQIRMLKKKVGLSRSGAFQDSRWQFEFDKGLDEKHTSRKRRK